MLIDEIEGAKLLFGCGFALFVALLAWGNQIRSPRMDVIELENDFVTQMKISKKSLKSLIREKEMSEFEKKYTNDDKLLGLLELVNKEVTSPTNIQVVNNFRNYHKIRHELEGLYNIKYYGTVIISMFLIISSAVTLFWNTFYIFSFILLSFLLLEYNVILMITYLYESYSIDHLTIIKDNLGEIK